MSVVGMGAKSTPVTIWSAMVPIPAHLNGQRGEQRLRQLVERDVAAGELGDRSERLRVQRQVELGIDLAEQLTTGRVGREVDDGVDPRGTLDRSLRQAGELRPT